MASFGAYGTLYMIPRFRYTVKNSVLYTAVKDEARSSSELPTEKQAGFFCLTPMPAGMVHRYLQVLDVL